MGKVNLHVCNSKKWKNEERSHVLWVAPAKENQGKLSASSGHIQRTIRQVTIPIQKLKSTCISKKGGGQQRIGMMWN